MLAYTFADSRKPHARAPSQQNGYHDFNKPSYVDDNGTIVVTARKPVSDWSRWILLYDHYELNPNYQKPWFDIGLTGYTMIPIAAFAGVGGAGAALDAGAALGPSGTIFGDTAFGAARQGSLNSGYYRMGFGRGLGQANFRIGIGSSKWDIFSMNIPR